MTMTQHSKRLVAMTHWQLKSGLSEQATLIEHLEDLLDQLEFYADKIWSLHRDLNVSMGLKATGYFPSQHQFVFSNRLLARISALNLNFDFDHYFLTEDPA